MSESLKISSKHELKKIEGDILFNLIEWKEF